MTELNFKTQNQPVSSTETAQKLRATAVYGVPQDICQDVTLVLADNSKDYTGPGTNTYIVGSDDVWIIDPGPNDQQHIDAVLSAVEGHKVLGILVTHSHLDHSPAAAPIKLATGAPVFGFGGLDPMLISQTDEDIDETFAPDTTLTGGELLGEGRSRCRVVHTPGHFPNHLCYYFEEQRILFSGDHVMGWSTTVIIPPLGNLADYMESLDVLELLGAKRMLPSHGLPVDAPKARIQEVRDHRHMRHEQIANCIADGLCDVSGIVAKLYEGLTPRLLKAAEGCVSAHLDQMRQESSEESLAHQKVRASA